MTGVGTMHRGGRRRGLRATAIGIAAAVVLAACGSGQSSTVDTRDVSALNEGDASLKWTACEQIACSTLSVPLDHSQPNGATLSLHAYARPSLAGSSAPVLVLIGDRDSAMSARDLVRDAPLTLGARVDDYRVVSVSLRGSADAPMPADAPLQAGSLSVVEDLEVLVTSLGVTSVRVIGWGNGATVAALWVMTHPTSVSAAVLDTPIDPSASLLKQGNRRISALAEGVEQMMRWCASHLSCPYNAETRRSWLTNMARIDSNNAPPDVTRDLLNQAGYAALVTADPGAFFRGLSEAMDGNSTRLLALAGSVPQVSAGTWRCADYRRSASRELATRWGDTRWRWFVPGSYAQLFAQCAALGDPPAPLGAIKPVEGARAARVLVTLARFDRTTSVDAPFAMAKKMKWKYRSVRVTHHFVVGYDRAITVRALEFLSA